MAKRTLKASPDDHLAIRIDSDIKKAFMDKARSEGKTASSVIMQWITAYLSAEGQEVSDISQVRTEVEQMKREMEEMRSTLMGKLVA